MHKQLTKKPSSSRRDGVSVARLSCRVCGRTFRNDGLHAYDRVIDHIETKHPKDALPFMQEIALLRRQEEK